MDFHDANTDRTVFVCKVHVYFLHRWEGDFQTTDEMATPTWFEKNNLPLRGMMAAERVWLPVVLAGKKVVGEASYTPFQESLIGNVKLKHVSNFLES